MGADVRVALRILFWLFFAAASMPIAIGLARVCWIAFNSQNSQGPV
jgi:hypothetical protein